MTHSVPGNTGWATLQEHGGNLIGMKSYPAYENHFPRQGETYSFIILPKSMDTSSTHSVLSANLATQTDNNLPVSPPTLSSAWLSSLVTL